MIIPAYCHRHHSTRVATSQFTEMSVVARQITDIMHGESSQFIHVFSELPEKLMAKLNAQRQDSSMCDVTIVTNDRQSHRAHKAILAASSRYLESELASLDNGKLESEAVIHLGMISSQSFETLLDFVYTSKLVLTSENVAQVLLAAEVLDLDQVSAICRQFLRSRVTSKSVIRGTDRSESQDDTFHGANNNIAVSDSPQGEFQRPVSFKRGQSEESMASSSGVSSVCSNSSQKEFDSAISCEPNYAANTPDDVSEGTVSLYGLPSSEGPQRDSQRPSSAPTTSSTEREGCPDLKFVENAKTLDDEPETDLSVRTDQLRRNIHSPAEFVDIMSTAASDLRTSGCSDVTGDDEKPRGDFHGTLYNGSERSVFKVKSEAHLVPESPEPFEYMNKSMKHLPSDSQDYGRYKSEGLASETPLNLSPIGRMPPAPYYALPEAHRRSYDSVFEHPTNDFINLNSTHIPARKKAKSVDQPQRGLPPYSPLPAMFPGQGTPSSLWASLYMMRSQALNYATSNLFPIRNQAEPDAALESSIFSRRQLQHSKSSGTSGALRCKLCSMEFTSDWSLAVHYHLCRPMSYFHHKPQRKLTDVSELSAHSNLGNVDNEKKSASDLHARSLLPPMKSGSSLAKDESVLSTGDAGVSKDFKAKIFGVFTPETKTTHRCYLCKKEFDSIFQLRKHKSVEHVKRPFRCHRCDSAFPNKAGLSVHLRSHTGERPYRCKICNKAFTQLGHVQRHQKVHTGEKPYQCPLCQTRVRDKASMHYHILAHQGVKPFQCDQCDARFTKRSSLVKHKNVHTGSFLYQCQQCKASFREKASLSRHVRSQHKESRFSSSTGVDL